MSTNIEKKKKKAKSPFLTPIILIGFAFLSFITALYMHGDTNYKMDERVPAAGGVIGPITIKKDNSVFEVSLSQNINYGKWSNVTTELLDQNKKSLFSFGKEFWAQTGYDSEGSWAERDTSVSSKFTIKKAGTYYLRFSGENSGVISDINIKVRRKKGSSIPHMVLGIILLLCGLISYSRSTDPKKRANFFNSMMEG